MSKTKEFSSLTASEFFKRLDLSKLDPNTAQYIRSEILSFENIKLLDGTTEFDEVRNMIEENYPQALGIIPVPQKDIEDKKKEPVKVPKEITGKVNKKEQKRLQEEEKKAAKQKHKQEVEEISNLIELMEDTIKDNPNDTDSKDYLELLQDTITELKKKKFEEGGRLSDDDNFQNDDYKLEYIGELIKKGNTSGYEPNWTLTITFDGEIDDADRQHIGTLVGNGFTSGEIVSGEESQTGWWSIKVGEEMAKGGGVKDNVMSDKYITQIYSNRNKEKAERLKKLTIPYGTAFGNIQIDIDNVFVENGDDSLKYKNVGYGGVSFMGNINGKTAGNLYYKNAEIKKEIEGLIISLQMIEDETQENIKYVHEQHGQPRTQHAILSLNASKYSKGGSVNSKYLDTISDDKKSKILKNIANHYGISVADAEQEVKDADAEMLYEYIANDQSLRMDVYNDFKSNKYAKGGGVGYDIDEQVLAWGKKAKIVAQLGKETNDPKEENWYEVKFEDGKSDHVPSKDIQKFNNGGGVGEGQEIEFFNEGIKEKAKAKKHNDAFYEITEGKHKGSLVHVSKVIKGYAEGGGVGVKFKAGDFVKKKGSNLSLKVLEVSHDKNDGKDYITIYNDVLDYTQKVNNISDYELVKYSNGGGVGEEIPYGVYFSLEDYKNFKNGNVSVGDEISMALSPSYQTVSKITRIEKKGKTIAIIEIKAKAGWIQPFLSSDRFDYDMKRLKDKKSEFNPETLIANSKKQLEKYKNAFSKLLV